MAPATFAAVGGELGLPLHRHFSSDEYDGFSSVTAVAHTKEGFTLFGTYHAAILFDGVSHEKIPVPATYVTVLDRDTDGVMWVGGDNEIGVLEVDPADGQLHYVSRMSRLPEDARAFGRLRAIAASRLGVFALTSTGILRFTGDRAERLSENPEANLQLFAVGGRIYLQDPRRGLLVFEDGGFRLLEAGAALAGRRIKFMERDAARALCVVEGEGVFNFEPASGRLEKIATPLAPLLTETLVRVLRLQDGRVVFIRGNNRGIVIADPTLQGAQALDARTGLTNTTILGAALDGDHGLWLATSNGLLRLDLAPGLTIFDERNAFPIGSSMSLVRHDGVLYAGSTQGLRRLVPGQPGAGTPARFVPDPRLPELCDNLRDTPEGLLFNTNEAVELLTPKGRERLFVPRAKVSMIKANRRAPGLYFIATDDGGVHVMNLPARTTKRVVTLPPGVILWNGADESERVTWFGTASSGFWRLSAKDDAWSEATAEAQPLGQAGLPDGKSWTGVFSLFNDLQFLTETGMYRRRETSPEFSLDQRFRIDGVTPLRFMPVVADPAGRAWTSPWLGTVTCARPLGYFQATSAGNFAWHDAPARWQAGVGRFGAGMILVESEGGRPILWTKSPTAIARIELDTLPSNRPATHWRPVLRRFMMGERSWPVAGGATLRLPFSNQPIMLRYATPRYQPGAPVRYQTRLVGFREEWSTPAAGNETVFTNLTGGPFTFEVRAIDADGFTSETARLTFSVAPPWHRSPAAIAAGILALAAGVFGFVRWRLGHAARERVRLERLVDLRTAQLKVAKDAADEANRAKSTFLANMSHELRTPLNGVIGYAQVLQRSPRISGEDRDRIQIMQTSGEHLLRMINEVLDFSKIEAGKLELHPAPFHLPQLLRDIAANHAARAEEKGLDFCLSYPDTLPDLLLGDAQKLRQVIDNLCSNAVKFTATGSVTLGVDPLPGERLTFFVTDTGVGIAPADRAQLFEPFHQAVEGRPAEPGTGLGLAICRRIVELMGGSLTVESERGAGSTFRFTVPLQTVAREAAPPTPRARHVTGYAGRRR
ncbi:MAG TPA: ATP-binding protein, partial [Opitutaceae bacterium]